MEDVNCQIRGPAMKVVPGGARRLSHSQPHIEGAEQCTVP